MAIRKYGMSVFVAAGMIFGQDSVSLAGHTRDVNVVACSSDGKMIASGAEDEKTFLWDTAAHQEIASVAGGGAVMSVSISPDGKRIASGERYHKVNLLDPAGKVVKVLEGHDAAVIATGFTADSKTLMTFSLDGGMRLWDAATGAPQGATKTPLDSYTAGAFSADGRWFAGGTSQSLYLYNVAIKKAGIKMQPGIMVRAVAFSPDGKTVAAALNDQTVRLYSTADGKEMGSIAGVEANGLAYSPDGTKIAAAGHDNDVKLIDAAGRLVVTTLKGHGRTVRSVCFLPGGRSVVSGSFDMTVRIWPLR
ncbi:MAG TPA: WD40 repeat domain-containing protein [Bryobacteraceae bacterium]|jgi:WD40 repeat protein|nr:WD40 repeat domain-containing protein [Bryobacteraceae bacterium]